MTRLSAFLITAASLGCAGAQDIPLKNWNAPSQWRLPSQQPAGSPRIHTDAAISTGLLTFVAVTPCRILDTRQSQNFPPPFGPPSFSYSTTRTVPIPSSGCGIPKAPAYSLNFTAVVPSTGLGFLTAYPDDGSQPVVSTLNSPAAGIVANAAIVPSGAADGGINVFTTNPTDVILDINGYYLDQIDTTGNNNTAVGIGALPNSTGNNNVSLGFFALHADTTGSNNVGIGSFSLSNVTTGSFNLGFGYSTLANATGSRNVGIGNSAGNALTSGNDNLYFSNQGVSTDSGVIRIGTANFQTSAFIAGVYNVPISGQTVVIDSNGQLGTVQNVSSRRYKDDIQDMADSSANLMRLRPVTFHYKQPAANGTKPLQYGLIAEEVAELYPEAVDYNAAGQVESVQYNKINAMLLNEVQKQRRELQSQTDEIQALKDRLTKLESSLQQR